MKRFNLVKEMSQKISTKIIPFHYVYAPLLLRQTERSKNSRQQQSAAREIQNRNYQKN